MLFFLAISVSSQAGAKSSVRGQTPAAQFKILQSSGSIQDLSLAKPAQWSMKSRLADRLHLKLSPQAQTKIQLNKSTVLTAFGGTEFEIPVISWESREFKEIRLIKGTLRLEVLDRPFIFDLTTVFFTAQFPQGVWVVHLDPERALMDVLSLEGELTLKALNAEESVQVKTGQKVTFRGILDENEIAFDLLLQGRKVPKGRWLPAENLTRDDRLKFSLEQEKKRQALERQQRAQSEREEEKRQALQICINPKADVGDCIWEPKGLECFRSRCTADGQWKDRQKVQSSYCEKASGWSAKPKACDY